MGNFQDHPVSTQFRLWSEADSPALNENELLPQSFAFT